MSGSSSRNKGAVYERELVRHLKKLGYHAERVYGSGAIGTRLNTETAQQLKGDVYVELSLEQVIENQLNIRHLKQQTDTTFSLEIEVKYRSGKQGFPQWLRELKQPTRIQQYAHGQILGVYPGYNFTELINYDFSKEQLWQKNTTRYLNMMGSSNLLAIRYPRMSQSPELTGWTMMLRL